MEVITYKCPNCGGDLTFDPASGKYKCEYCLSSLDKSVRTFDLNLFLKEMDKLIERHII